MLVAGYLLYRRYRSLTTHARYAYPIETRFFLSDRREVSQSHCSRRAARGVRLVSNTQRVAAALRTDVIVLITMPRSTGSVQSQENSSALLLGAAARRLMVHR